MINRYGWTAPRKQAFRSSCESNYVNIVGGISANKPNEAKSKSLRDFKLALKARLCH